MSLLDWWRPTDEPEITDALVAYDPATLARRPVRRDDVVALFRDAGRRRAARLVAALPARADGVLDEGAIDRRLVAIHCEMQQLHEEFEHGGRVAELLRPILGALRDDGAPGPLRVVDVGCGTGFVARWLAAHGGLGDDVAITGCDYNAAFVAEAERLAAAERLSVDFRVANALTLEVPASVLVSTAVLHHLRGDALGTFLAGHDTERTRAFVHFDFQRMLVAPPGSWLFHVVRFRDPIARYDGVLSAVRAHANEHLVRVAREALPGFRIGLYFTRLLGPIPCVFTTLVGVRPEHEAAFVRRLGRRARRLGELA